MSGEFCVAVTSCRAVAFCLFLLCLPFHLGKLIFTSDGSCLDTCSKIEYGFALEAGTYLRCAPEPAAWLFAFPTRLQEHLVSASQ